MSTLKTKQEPVGTLNEPTEVIDPGDGFYVCEVPAQNAWMIDILFGDE